MIHTIALIIRGLLGAVTLVLVTSASAQEASREAALAFDRNAKSVIASFSPVHKYVAPAKSGGLVRTDWTMVEPPLVDVKRTDSLVDPVQATVDMRATLAGAGPAPTEDELSRIEAKPMDEYRIQAVFVPAGKGWTFRSGRYSSKALGGRWFDLKPEQLRAERLSPFAELVKHFEVN